MEGFRAVSGQEREMETYGQGGLWAGEAELWTQTGQALQEHCWGEPHLLGLVLFPEPMLDFFPLQSQETQRSPTGKKMSPHFSAPPSPP